MKNDYSREKKIVLKIVGENFKMSKSVRQLEVYGCGSDNVISWYSNTSIFSICYDT